MEVFTGRPVQRGSRSDKEMRVYDLLDQLGIKYQRVEHEEAKTMEACEEIDRALDVVMCKNLFLCNRQETDFYLLMMPGDKPFRTKDLSRQIKSARLSFARAEYMEEFLDITPGSVSVTGLMNDKNNRVQLLIDRETLDEKYLGCHPGINTASLKIEMADLVEKFLPEVHHEMIVVDLPHPEQDADRASCTLHREKND